MKKTVIVTAVAGALALGFAAPAYAGTYGPGKITAYYKNTNSINPFHVYLSDGDNPWLFSSTYFVSCTGAGISDGSLISMTRLGQVKSANKTVKIVTSGTSGYIACQ